MSAIAEPLQRRSGLDVGREPPPPIGLPPAEVVPESVRPVLRRYAVEPSEASRAPLVLAVDQVGRGWEHAIAARAMEARAELGQACRRAAVLHDELVALHAAARWLQRFPWRSSWEPEPYSLYVAGRLVAVPEILGAIEDTVDVDERLVRIARWRGPEDSPYEPPAPRKGRRGAAPALNALNEAGSTLGDVAELADATESAVSHWLAGRHPYPERLPGVLERLAGAETAAQIVALIPAARRPPMQPPPGSWR